MSLEISLSAWFEKTEGSGQDCAECGDRCFLEAWVLMFECDGGAEETDYVVCGSCGYEL